MKYTLLMLLLIMAGCDAYKPVDWERAPREYTCTEQQTQRVEADTLFCNKNTSYYSTACYGFAIMRNCTKNQVKS